MLDLEADGTHVIEASCREEEHELDHLSLTDIEIFVQLYWGYYLCEDVFCFEAL